MKLCMGITRANLGCAVTVLGLSVGLPAQAAGFDFTQISNSANSPFSIFRNADINDQGLVAFEAFPSQQAPPSAIFAGNGGQPFPLVISDNTRFNATFNASLNNQGAASFTGNLVNIVAAPGGPPAVTLVRSGIYTSDKGVINTIADTTGGAFNFFTSSDINDAGTVAFLAGFGRGDVGIFTSDKGTIAPIATTTGLFSAFSPKVGLTGVADYANSGFIDTVGGDGPFAIYTIPSINNSGAVAFAAELNLGGAGVFTSKNGILKTIADTSSIFKRFSSAAINDQGTVAFVGELVNGDRGLFTSTDQGLKTIVDTSGAFSFFNSDPALNNKGEVAFLAELDDGGKGIFAGADPIADKVVSIGDSINGLSVQDLIIIGKGLNDDGQVAFSAVLSDGSERIFRAKRVPEPGSIAGLAAIGLIGGWLKRHRRNSAA